MRVAIPIGLAALFCAGPALAQDVPPEPLERARQLYDEQSYREALSIIEPLATEDGLDALRRLEAIRQLAILRLVLRDDVGAQLALLSGLSRDPRFDLGPGDHPPRFAQALATARAAGPATIAVRLSTSNTRVEEQTVVFEATVEEHADAVASVVVMHRLVGEVAFLPLDLSSGQPYRGSRNLPAEADAVEFYMEARAPSGAVLGAAGTAEAPLRIEVPAPSVLRDFVAQPEPPRRMPRRQRQRPHRQAGGVPTWAWVAGGAVLAGVGATVGLLLAQPDPARDGTWGNVELGR